MASSLPAPSFTAADDPKCYVLVPSLAELELHLGKKLFYMLQCDLLLCPLPDDEDKCNLVWKAGTILVLERFTERSSNEERRAVLKEVHWEMCTFEYRVTRKIAMPLSPDFFVLMKESTWAIVVRERDELAAYWQQYRTQEDAKEALRTRHLPSLADLTSNCGKGRYYVAALNLQFGAVTLRPGDILKGVRENESAGVASNASAKCDTTTRTCDVLKESLEQESEPQTASEGVASNGNQMRLFTRVIWDEHKPTLGEVIQLPLQCQTLSQKGVFCRIGPDRQYIMKRGQLLCHNKAASQRALQKGERYIHIPPLASIKRACGGGRYYIVCQDLAVQNSHTMDVINTFPDGMVLKLLEGSLRADGASSVADFQIVHWEGWRRAGKTITLDSGAVTFPWISAIEEMTDKRGYAVIRNISAQSGKKCDSKQATAGGVNVQAVLPDEKEVVEQRTSADEPLGHYPADPGDNSQDNDVQADAGPITATLAGSASVEPVAEVATKGICVACLELEATFVQKQCGHLVYCASCRRRAVARSFHVKDLKVSRKDLSAKDMRNTKVTCPMCRVDSVLVETQQYKGSIWIAEPF